MTCTNAELLSIEPSGANVRKFDIKYFFLFLSLFKACCKKNIDSNVLLNCLYFTTETPNQWLLVLPYGILIFSHFPRSAICSGLPIWHSLKAWLVLGVAIWQQFAPHTPWCAHKHCMFQYVDARQLWYVQFTYHSKWSLLAGRVLHYISSRLISTRQPTSATYH